MFHQRSSSRCMILAALFVMFSCCMSWGQPTTKPDQADVRSWALARIEKLQNVSVKLEDKITYSQEPPPAELQAHLPKNDRVLEGTRNLRGSFSLLGSRARYETECTGGEPADEVRAEPLKRIFIKTPDRTESYAEFDLATRKMQTGDIEAAAPIPRDVSIDIALGLRMMGEQELLTNDAVASFDVVKKGDDTSLRYSGDRLTTDWIFDDKLRALTACRISSRDILAREYLCSDFRNIDGIQLPFSIIVHQYLLLTRTQTQYVGITEEITIERYMIGDEHNTKDSYVMQWPLGTEVLDGRTKTEMHISSATRPLSDEDIRNVRIRSDMQKAGAEVWSSTRPTTGP